MFLPWMINAVSRLERCLVSVMRLVAAIVKACKLFVLDDDRLTQCEKL